MIKFLERKNGKITNKGWEESCESTLMNGPVGMYLFMFFENAHPSNRRDFQKSDG